MLLAPQNFPAFRSGAGAKTDLLPEINKIKAIDNHAHPPRVVSEGEGDDSEMDALTLEGLEPAPIPFRLRADHPEYIDVLGGDLGSCYKQVTGG